MQGCQNAYSYTTKTTTHDPNSHVNQVTVIGWSNFQFQMHEITNMLIDTEKDCISYSFS